MNKCKTHLSAYLWEKRQEKVLKREAQKYGEYVDISFIFDSLHRNYKCFLLLFFGKSFQLAIIVPRINIIGYDTATAQSLLLFFEQTNLIIHFIVHNKGHLLSLGFLSLLYQKLTSAISFFPHDNPQKMYYYY